MVDKEMKEFIAWWEHRTQGTRQHARPAAYMTWVYKNARIKQLEKERVDFANEIINSPGGLALHRQMAWAIQVLSKDFAVEEVE